MYLTREQSLEALKNMRKFNGCLRILYSDFGMNLESNLGRRNILLSGAQEKFFADALKASFPNVRNDGHTGEPDIIIPELNKELECKLTTRYQSTGALSFQTDSMSFENKANGLDFLYVVADELFESFAVLHFIGLNRDDFHKEHNGARGRIRMKKYAAMPKCRVLVGSVEDIRAARIAQYTSRLSDVLEMRTSRLDELERRIERAKVGTKARSNTQAIFRRENERFSRSIRKVEALLHKWQTKEPMYSVVLENIGDEECQSLTCAA